MQTCNSLHTQCMSGKHPALEPGERLGDSGPFYMLLYCCIFFQTVMFFVSRTTLNALYDKHLAGLMLRLFLVLWSLFMRVYVRVHVHCESLDSSTVILCMPPSF